VDYSSPGSILNDVKTTSIPTQTAKAASTPVDSAVSEVDRAASIAANRIKEGWRDGVQSARELKQKAAENWSEVADSVDRYVEARPKTVALTALGAGLALGYLAGILVQRNRN
jgi:ElaB/YqjD/DUF883 family membrane-anchored ribosome-binding protein